MKTPSEIRAWMQDHGITQIELAEKCRVTRGTMNKILTGARKSPRIIQLIEGVMDQSCPTEKALRQIAKKEGVSVEEIALRIIARALSNRKR